jgi:hypothetical protein
MRNNLYHRKLKLSRVSSPTFDQFLNNKLGKNNDETNRKYINEERDTTRV